MSNLVVLSGAGGGKDSGSGSITPVEDPDSLRSIQYARIIFLLGEGENQGLVDGFKSITFNGTPIQNDNGTFNFLNVSMDERTGTQNQSYIPNFGGAESEHNLGLEVTHSTPITFTISNTSVSSVRLTMGVPNLTFQDLTNGHLQGTDVSYKVDVQSNGGGFVPYPLRQLYLPDNFSLASGQGTTTADATKFKVSINWLGNSTHVPQTCKCKLQYKLITDSTWTDSNVITFSGSGSFSYNNNAGAYFGDSLWSPPSGSKTIPLTLPSGKYNFRAVLISGTGTVSISSGLIYQPVLNDTISGKTTSRYQRAKLIQLTGDAPWDIRVTRITDDSTSSNLNNKTFLDSYTEIVDVKLRYPNRHIVAVKVDAKQFSSIPTVGFLARGRLIQIPSNYDPLTRIYTGTWDGTFQNAWSNNPAWCFYDLITNDRYGLGEFISASQVDKWALYKAAQYCDELVDDGYGGLEPRFTCNLYLQTREQAYTVLANLASIFRGMVWWQTGSATVSFDGPQDAVQLFTPANIVNGVFNYTSSSSRVRHTVVLVTWNDPQNQSKQKIEYVEDPIGIQRYGVIQSEIVGFGCDSRGQATRLGRATIFTDIYESETVSFTSGMDTVFSSPGEVIKTSDPGRAGARFGGRLLAATVSQVQLDAPITLDVGTSYTISIKMPDGSIEDRAITTSSGTTDTIDITPDLSAIPNLLAIWVVGSDAVQPESWRIVQMTEKNKTQIDITAIAYRSDKYAYIEDNLILEPIQTGLIKAVPNTISNLHIVESLYLAALGVIGTRVTISWDADISSQSYILTYQKNGFNQTIIEGIKENSIDISPIDDGDYVVTIQGVNSFNVKGPISTVNITIYGKTSPPSDITNFVLSPQGNVGMFSWDLSKDLDVIVGGSVVFRYSPDTTATWTSALDLAHVASGSSTSITLPLKQGIYFAAFKDSTGHLSSNPVSIITDITNVLNLNVVESITETTVWAGTKTQTEYDSIHAGLTLSAVSGVPYASGSYHMGTIDIGVPQSCRISTKLDAFGLDLAESWDSTDLIDSEELIDSGDVSDVYAKMFVRYTNDDPLGTPTWSAFEHLSISDITARAFDFELRLSTDNPLHNVVVKSAVVTVDMPDRTESGNDIASGAAVYTVTYAKKFVANPALSITAQNMATGDYYRITSKTITGFTITFYNASGTIINRTFDYFAKGY